MSSVNLDRHSKLLVNRYGNILFMNENLKNGRICNWIVVTIFWIIGTLLVFKIVLSYLLILLTMIKILKNYTHPINHPQQRHHWIRTLHCTPPVNRLSSLSLILPLSRNQGFIPGFFRRRRQAEPENELDPLVTKLFKMALDKDSNSCSLRLTCKIGTKPLSSLSGHARNLFGVLR